MVNFDMENISLKQGYLSNFSLINSTAEEIEKNIPTLLDICLSELNKTHPIRRNIALDNLNKTQDFVQRIINEYVTVSMEDMKGFENLTIPSAKERILRYNKNPSQK